MNWLIYFVNMYILLNAFSHDYCLRYKIGLKSFAGILRYAFNSFLARGDFCLLLITLANSLVLDQDPHSVGPDLDPNHLTL